MRENLRQVTYPGATELATDEGEELVDICSDVLAELGQLAGLNVEEKVTSERVR